MFRTISTIALVLALLLVPSAFAAPSSPDGDNLIANGDFEAGEQQPGVPRDWAAFWSHDKTGELQLDTAVHHGGAHALKVVHAGNQDWSVSHGKTIPVKPGDILAISAWVKCDQTQQAQIGVVLRDANNKVLEWVFGRAETKGTHDWQQLTRRLIIPEQGATVQFRLTGGGNTIAWFDDVAMVRQGNLSDAKREIKAPLVAFKAGPLQVRCDAIKGTLAVSDPRGDRHEWHQEVAGGTVVVTGAEAIEKNGGARWQCWDLANDLHFETTIVPASAGDEAAVQVTLSGKGAVTTQVDFPYPFVTPKGTELVVPLNEGITYPVDDATIGPMRLVAYSGHGICMPWFGACEASGRGAGMMAVLGTPDDAGIEIVRPKEGMTSAGTNLYVRPFWEASRGDLSYPRQIKYVFFDKGGYVAQAKEYRDHVAKVNGLFRTLKDKGQGNPNVDRLIGAVNVWNFGDLPKIALCQELKSLGMEHVLWSGGGKSEELKAINQLGYLSGRYDIFQDVWAPEVAANFHEGWPDELVLLPSGDWMKGWAIHRKNKDGSMTVIDGGVICSTFQAARARRRLAKDLAVNPYGARFIDTTTASPWRECYNPKHPLTRSEDRKYKMQLLEVCSKDFKLVVGTETGIDPSVPYVHYYEGMLSLGPYRLPDSGRDMLLYKAPTDKFLKFQVGHFYRVPLWELVYHDCVVAQWYWDDYNNKAPEVWDRRDLFNLLYGTPPMFMFDKAVWAKSKDRFVQSYRNVCPLVRRLGYEQMVSHEFVTADHAVQRTTWSNGTVITVNFGDAEAKLPDGTKLAAGAFAVRG